MKKIVKLAGAFIVGILFGVIGIWLGICLVSGKSPSDLLDKFATTNGMEVAGSALVSGALAFIVFFLQVILHEAGHLVFGLATGYRFVSFRVFNLTFIKQNGKICIKRFSVAGTGGQCLLTPPDRPLEEIPTVWYNLGGVIANLLSAAVAIILLLTIDEMSYHPKLFLILVSTFGILLGLSNGIPMKMGGIGNDADNMRLLLKDSKSKRALVLQLRINALVQEGKRPKDMPAEWFSLENEINYKDALQTSIPLMASGRLQDLEDWDGAYAVLEEIISHKDEIIGLYVKETNCELMFTALMKGLDEQAAQLYTEELRTYINQYKKVMSSKQRILCAVALYLDKDAAKAKEIYDTVCRRKEQYLMQGEVNMDIALMKSFLTAANAL